MTVQIPERILLDSKPHWLYATPLYRLLATRRTRLAAPNFSTTACHRQYVGTWEIIDGRLWLVALSTYGDQELQLSGAMRTWFLRLVPASGFPVCAEWFNGHLRVPTGPMLVRGLSGWSSWFTRERVISCRQGRVVRDREVDTLAMLEWALRRSEVLKQELDPEDSQGGPLAWIADGDYEHLRGDWWPPTGSSALPNRLLVRQRHMVWAPIGPRGPLHDSHWWWRTDVYALGLPSKHEAAWNDQFVANTGAATP